MSAAFDEPLVRAEDLSVAFRAAIPVAAAREVSLEIRAREVVALVGESGSGKSTIGLSLLGLLAPSAAIAGSIRLRRKGGETVEIVGAGKRLLRGVRGNDVAMVFQEPMSSLNPIYRVGDQIVEALRVHRRFARGEARREALRLLVQLGIPSPEACLGRYPHELSGGMRQRVMIAMALGGRPALLVADEPTTALDVTIQAQIVDLLRAVQRETGMAVLFITHDLGLVAEIAARVVVMYAGQVVEEGPVAALFGWPLMPYTRALLASRPRLGERRRVEPIPGSVPNLARLPAGCSFHPRCAFAVKDLCDRVAPALEPAGDGRRARCHRWREIEGLGA